MGESLPFDRVKKLAPLRTTYQHGSFVDFGPGSRSCADAGGQDRGRASAGRAEGRDGDQAGAPRHRRRRGRPGPTTHPEGGRSSRSFFLIGNPRAAETVGRAHAANRAAADQFAANVLPIVRTIQTSGITSLAGIAEALNARGVRTARGGEWHASTVRNLLARA
jgi:hypothetical protein